MAFQNTAGTIIIDAVLTEAGRRKMAQGNFKISKFSLGDAEIDYSHGHLDASAGKGTGDGYFYLYGDQDGPFPTSGSGAPPPTLEALTNEKSGIVHGLINFQRQDLLYLPTFVLNNKIDNSTKLRDGVIYLSVNEETSKKLKNHININTELINNNEMTENMIVYESGINTNTGLEGNIINRERFIYNLKLYDSYVFVYCNKNYFDKILVNNPEASFKNDENGNLYQNLLPLTEVPKTSIKNFLDNYDTYYCKTVENLVTDGESGTAANNISNITGPRSSVFGLNFLLNPKLTGLSNGAADKRYTTFGKTAQTLFGGSDTFDYIDTEVMIEGISSLTTHSFTVRIIRYAG